MRRREAEREAPQNTSMSNATSWQPPRGLRNVRRHAGVRVSMALVSRMSTGGHFARKRLEKPVHHALCRNRDQAGADRRNHAADVHVSVAAERGGFALGRETHPRRSDDEAGPPATV